MPVALGVVLGVLLAVVFSAAALGKLTDLAGTRDGLAGFGLPRALVAPVALALPAAELAVAVLLLFGVTRVAGAAGALGLLAIFSVAIIANLARGRTPDCHCFGRLHSAPAGWGTVARNAVLAACATALLAAGSSALRARRVRLGREARTRGAAGAGGGARCRRPRCRGRRGPAVADALARPPAGGGGHPQTLAGGGRHRRGAGTDARGARS